MSAASIHDLSIEQLMARGAAPSPPVEMTVRCRPWRHDSRLGEHRVLIDLGEHPRIRVWDPIGRIFTVCHSLSNSAQRRIIRQAGSK